MLKIVVLLAIAFVALITALFLPLPAAVLENAAAAWQWLLTPISGASTHDIATTVAWHGRLMVLAWVLILPPSIVVARFFKITPGQDWPREINNPFWFLAHRQTGYWIGAIATAGIALVLWGRGAIRPFEGLHGALGWAVFLLGWVQIVNSLLRGTHGGPVDPFTRVPLPPEQWPGDHFCMTRRRVIFEYVHKSLGYALVALALTAVFTGLRAADAPRWMWLAIAAWTALWVAIFVKLQREGRCIDTYQAIWGLDDTLPGYRRKPIGWGIRRIEGKHVARLSAGEAPRIPAR